MFISLVNAILLLNFGDILSVNTGLFTNIIVQPGQPKREGICLPDPLHCIRLWNVGQWVNSPTMHLPSFVDQGSVQHITDEPKTIAAVFILSTQEKPCWTSLPIMIKLHHITLDQYSQRQPEISRIFH